MDRLSSLERLAKLKADGVLTEEEFSKEKKWILEGNTGNSDDNGKAVDYESLPTYHASGGEGISARFFSTRGRISREQWIKRTSVLCILLIAGILLPGLMVAIGKLTHSEFGDYPRLAATSYWHAVAIAALYGLFAVAVKRFHDFGRSGWAILIPLYNMFAPIYLPGDAQDNRFGPPPRSNEDVKGSKKSAEKGRAISWKQGIAKLFVITASAFGIVMTALVFTAPPYPIRALTSNYPGCDTPDIVLENGQRWAACNAGANEAYLTADQSLPFENSTANGGPDAADKAYMGAYYQWGRNTDVTIGAAVSGPLDVVAAASENGFIKSHATRDWILPEKSYFGSHSRNDNLWGGEAHRASPIRGWRDPDWFDATFWAIRTGEFSEDRHVDDSELLYHHITRQSDRDAMQGPCAEGYHVPTATEWSHSIESVTSGSFDDELKLPTAGYRDHSSAAYFHQSTYGYYWTSTPADRKGAYSVKVSTYDASVERSWRANGYSVRCISNFSYP